MALLIVFLVLAAQFESFVHPLVILVTVPLAVAGALLGLHLTGMSKDSRTQSKDSRVEGFADTRDFRPTRL